MSVRTAQVISRSGLEPVYTAADVAGDEFVNTGRKFFHIKNGDGSPHTMTIETPNTVDTLAIADRDVVIPAGEERMIGPFAGGTYNDSAGSVQVTYDAVTSVTLALVRPGT